MRNILGIILFLISAVAYGQSEVEALRYSYQLPLGSARSMSMGGAFGALGGDLSTVSQNPAGIGIFRRNEFSISFGVNGHTSETSFGGAPTISSNQAKFNIPQIGLLGTAETNHPLWKRVNYAIGYHRYSDYNQVFDSRGPQNNNSLLELFAMQANGTNSEDIYDAFPFGAALAWDAFLINPIDTNSVDQYTSANPFGNFQATKLVERSGHMGETVASIGGSYDDRLYVGFTLGFPNINFNEVATYTEADIDPAHELGSFRYREELNTSGRGANFKVGLIYKVTELFRIGAAFHSPSWLTINDNYETSIVGSFRDGDVRDSESPINNFEYRVRTPSRMQANAAFILGKKGLISADYEFVNYKNIRMRDGLQPISTYGFDAENEAISNLYRGTHNVKIGTEIRFKPWAVRAGVAYFQSPIDPAFLKTDQDRILYSLGIGYRKATGYIDLAYQLSFWQEEFYHYEPNIVSASTVDNKNGQVVFTIGFRY